MLTTREQEVQPFFLSLARRLFLAALLFGWGAAATAQPLPSWNEGPAKARILAFVQAVIDKAGKEFVPPAEREYAYDRKSSVGRLDKALDEANAKGWTVVSMKTDWKKIFPFE